ncbi:hypothetical protein GWI33_021435 [Rhynchophorus ferrugineus]|uniref:Uncharacterized protein n=1 Tax=Rhynchophorus ferrugineus TaxID=354439 RepID=A0A834HPJ7_RHYFE|nr:hypothetical protein GWI33_021435 [Rhynchophorus ferrugineus]
MCRSLKVQIKLLILIAQIPLNLTVEIEEYLGSINEKSDEKSELYCAEICELGIPQPLKWSMNWFSRKWKTNKAGKNLSNKLSLYLRAAL